MGLLLPCGLALLLFDFLRRSSSSDDSRETLCLVALALGMFVACGTELLNALHLLTSGGVHALWSLGCLAVLALRLSQRGLPSPPPWTPARQRIAEADWLARGMALTIFVFVTVTGLVAWQAVPNNYDSMTYHLARVIYWRQDHSIAFFATPNESQNAMPPLAEWIILHFSLLQGDAHAANLPQWASYVGCIAGVSLLAERMGGTPRTGLLAAFFAATLPAAVLEATSTQNDLVMAFWLVCLAYGCVVLSRGPGWKGVFIVGAAAGLGLLTKTVVVLFSFPLLLWALILLFRHGLRQFAPRAALAGLLILGLNLGHFARNEATSGNPFGPGLGSRPSAQRGVNTIHTPAAVFSNVIRNLALHAMIYRHASFAEHLIERVHHLLGLDPNDPRTTFNSFPFAIRDYGEDGSPMPFHVAATLVALGVALTRLRRELPLAVALSLAILAGAFLFCLVLRWQPFHSRLHLPLLMLAAPVVALVWQRRAFRFFLLPALLVFAAPTVPKVFVYHARPALGRGSVFVASADEQQYASLPVLREPYVHALQLLRENQVHDLGLISKGNNWEYPFAAYGNFHALWRTDHVLIPAGAAFPAETTCRPDALVCTRAGFGDTLDLDGQIYRRIYAFSALPKSGSVPVGVYLRQPNR